MAAGIVVFNSWPSSVQNVADSSCSTILPAANTANIVTGGSALWKPVGCSTNPVVVGTLINWVNGSQTANWSVTSITATPSTNINSTTNIDPLISTVIVCAYVCLFFMGFHSGGVHGNR